MKTKKTQFTTLKKETIANLESKVMKEVYGGSLTYTCLTYKEQMGCWV